MSARAFLRCGGAVLGGFEGVYSAYAPVFGLPSWRPWEGGLMLLLLVLVGEM